MIRKKRIARRWAPCDRDSNADQPGSHLSHDQSGRSAKFDGTDKRKQRTNNAAAPTFFRASMDLRPNPVDANRVAADQFSQIEFVRVLLGLCSSKTAEQKLHGFWASRKGRETE
jgi:hypothetical protein